MADTTAITIRLTFTEANELRERLVRAMDVAAMLSRSFISWEDQLDDDAAADLALLRNLANAIGTNLTSVWKILDQASGEDEPGGIQ